MSNQNDITKIWFTKTHTYFTKMANNANRLKVILTELGFKKVIPTEKLLSDLNMTSHRFVQILENKGKKPMTLIEYNNLMKWLSGSLSGRSIELFEQDRSRSEVTA